MSEQQKRLPSDAIPPKIETEAVDIRLLKFGKNAKKACKFAKVFVLSKMLT
ncbi:hypothetical protein [Moraxella porci]|uniref:hypothetical protein n=1 Tax=Moraxella porci TaxID=1288392 RepID=UPI00244C948A|nr:hypothetical protein [Moraxella porci]MDH2273076.1 hypothetical protein [Moraxella porci]